MQRFIQAQDVARAQFANHFTEPHSGGAVNLVDEKKIFAITEVRAGGAWSCVYFNSDKEGREFTRNGSGNASFFIPWVAETMRFTGVTEVSGYWIPAGLVM